MLQSFAGSRILLVEDDDLIAMSLSMVLEDSGVIVVGPFDTAEDAARALHGDSVQAAVLDIHLTGGTSFQLAQALEERSVPYAFLSGRPPRQLPGNLSPIAYLQKPAKLGQVLELITRLLASGR